MSNPGRTITPRTGPNADVARPAHEQGLLDALKSYVTATGKESNGGGTGNKSEESAMDAMNKGVSDAPGNSTDY